ncbi:MAG: sugar nucleotide-binding protein [Ferruginibacter sp.]|nr:sugar nucleotide-binding protein [Ferruginibacter sp.]
MSNATNPIPLWGGIECTINRIEDHYYDQLEMAGHYQRDTDIKAFASLGIRALRYPILWEKHQPEKDSEIDWRFSEQRLNQVREQGIVPIAGLLHHGSGPAFTRLDHPAFPELFAAYAKQVAERFPWLEYYTPINEPLTTARFSGLYGLWYPHASHDISFVRMLLNQLKATVLAMAAIREVNPAAKLVQTEDLGKTYSSPRLKFQADFENERRWCSVDLLCGKLQPGDAMYDYCLRLGITEQELQWFNDHPCPPDIIGANYYITSERFLDEELEKYPPHTHGGNEVLAYADVEAIRVQHGQPWGIKLLLSELWNRYQLPIAITECHLACSREDQLRWFSETVDNLEALRDDGVDIRAITAWSLLGSFGWDKLLTSPAMRYETGVFDCRSGSLRPTAMASLLRSYSQGEERHPLCGQPGWWHTQFDILQQEQHAEKMIHQTPILVLGKTGTLGQAFARYLQWRNIPFVLAGREDADVRNNKKLLELVDQVRPWAVINATGFVDIDAAETNPEDCLAVNFAAPVLLANICAKRNIGLLNFSSDQVFDGRKTSPYLEDDTTNPLNVYGRTKAMAERQLTTFHPGHLHVRTSAFFGPDDAHNFVTQLLEKLARGEEVTVAGDEFISPTYVPDLVAACTNLLIDGESGIRHLTNGTAISWARLAKDMAQRYGMKKSLVRVVGSAELKRAARRPLFVPLQSNYPHDMPPLEDALGRYMQEKTLAMV